MAPHSAAAAASSAAEPCIRSILTGNYRVLHSFSFPVDGSEPGPDLLEASDGNFYGATQFVDTVFRIDSTGALTTLHRSDRFAGRVDSGRRRTCLRDDGRRGPRWWWHHLHARCARDAHHRSRFQRRRERWATKWRDPGTERSFLWHNRFPRAVLGAFRDRLRDGCFGTRTTLHQFEWGPLSTAGGAPMSNLFEGDDGSLYGTTFSESGLPISPGAIFKITPTGDFTTCLRLTFYRRE